MSDDLLITPGSRKQEFKDSSGNVDAKIETDASGNLIITNPGGDISIGDTTADIFVGDGTNNVDIVFEQSGEIRGTTGVTLTLGQSDSSVRMATDLNLNSNNITNVNDLTITGDLNVTGNINSTSVTDLDVTDKTITLGVGQTEANSGNSGIIIDGSSASMLWDESNDRFSFNKGISTSGVINASGTSASSFYAANFTRSSSGTTTPDIWGSSGTLVLGTSSTDEAIAMSGANTLLHGNLEVEGADVTITANVIHAGDTNTYFGFHGNDLWRVVTGGSERIEVGNSGIRINENGADMDFTIESDNNANMFFVDGGNDRIGIGTSSPTDILTITGDAKYIASHDGTNYAFKLGADSSGDGNFMLHDSSGAVKVKLYAEANAANYINNGGDFGIGTATPNNKLTVSGSSDGINITGTSSYLRWNSGDMMIRNEGSYAMGFHTYNGSSAMVERMRITSAGNVGIGTSSPSTKLHVNGDSTFQMATFYGDYSSTNSTINLLADNNGVGAGIAFSDNGTPSGTSNQRGHLTFYHGDGQSFGSGASFRFETSESTLSVLVDGKLLYKEGIYVKPGSGTGAGTLLVDSSRNITAVTGAFSGKAAVMSSSVHGSYDFYNNGTSYFNGSVVIDDQLNMTGSSRAIKMNGNTIVDSAGAVFARDYLAVGSDTGSLQAPKKVLELSSNSSNTERGPWNPIVSSIRNSGYRLHPDEDFRDGTNGVSVYNNAGGGVVSITREDATTNSGGAAPNASGKVLRINHNGGTSSPGLGGFVQNIPSEDNHTFVQIFQAKLRTGSSLVIAENAQGSNSRSYFLTDTAGTGKWEWYARVSHCGNDGTFSSGGHIYVSGGSGNFDWFLASCTVYDVTESHYGQINVGDGGQTLANIHIRKADNDTSDHIVFYNGTTRVGEIGVQDGTWLRLNQVTNKNIYTPRYIRADAGFFVDSTSKGINGSGNFIGGTIAGASDANVTNWDAAYNDKINSASFNTGNGIITLNQQDGGTVTVDIDGRFLTSYTETDTLDSVCDRGSSTNQNITANALIGTNYVKTGGTGQVALTVNDGQGNANVTFNHQDGIPDFAGNCFRIVTNVDSTSSPQMNIEMVANSTTGSSVNTPSAMEIEPSAVDITQYLRHMGDTDTYVQFTDNRVRIAAGGTVKFDSNNTYLTSISSSDVTGALGFTPYNATNPSGYITGNQTITLSGDVSGSGTTSISVTVADDSHNHVISNVDGLQTALDGKAGLSSANTFTANQIISGGTPTLTLSDSNNGGGGAASGKLMFKNTSGNAMAIGYTSNVTSDSDMIISTNGGGTYGSYIGLNAGGISDAQSDIILEPKTDVRIATGDLRMGNIKSMGISGATLTVGDVSGNDDIESLILQAFGGNGALTIGDAVSTFDGYVEIAERLRHQGDTDTYLKFSTDKVEVYAGGVKLIEANEASSGYDFVNFGPGAAGLVLFNLSSGTGHFDGDVVAFSSTTSSDLKLKENVRDLEGALDKTLKLRGVKFDWKDESRSNDEIGFIAQEIEQVLPEVVSEVDSIGDRAGETHKVVNYQAVVPLLVEAMKEQQNIINRLEDRIKDLENKNGE